MLAPWQVVLRQKDKQIYFSFFLCKAQHYLLLRLKLSRRWKTEYEIFW